MDFVTNKTLVGTKVHYSPGHGKKENGIVKETRDNGAFVVYHCNNDWENYRDYTGQLTPYDTLRQGWVEKEN